MSDKHDIRTGREAEFNTKVPIGDQEYLVITDNLGGKKQTIITTVYLNGETVSSAKTDFRGEGGDPSEEISLPDFMKRQHNQTINLLREKKLKEVRSSADYIEETKRLLRRKNFKNALVLLEDAVAHYPEDPFVLSYYGYTLAQVEKQGDKGVLFCKKAIEVLHKTVPLGKDAILPTFYLNLGRAYVSTLGLKIDPRNNDLIWELKKLGTRRKPPIPFLSRSNPLNKYLGKIIYKIRGR